MEQDENNPMKKKFGEFWTSLNENEQRSLSELLLKSYNRVVNKLYDTSYSRGNPEQTRDKVIERERS